MKKQIIILCACFMVYSISAQFAPGLAWQKSLGGSSFEVANSVCTTADGAYFILGFSSSQDGHVIGNHGGYDMWGIKINESGDFFQIPLGGSSDEKGYKVKQCPDGGYILIGGSSSNDGQVTGNHGNSDVWVVKLNAGGSIDWQKSLGGSLGESAHAVELTSDGGYLIGASTDSNDGDVSSNHGSLDVWLVKLDAFGTMEWEKTYGGSNVDVCYSLLETEDGGYIMAGNSSSMDGDVVGNHGDGDYWIVKIDADGNIQWQNCLGGTDQDEARDIIVSSDGYYYVSGYTTSEDGDIVNPIGSFDFWLVKLDANGDIVWSQCYGGTGIDLANTLIEYNGNIVLAGSTNSVNGDVSLHIGGDDFWVLSVNPNGDILWEKSLGGLNNDHAYDLVGEELGLLVVGSSLSNDGHVTENFGGQDIWLAKLEWTEGLIESQNRIARIYPNPIKNEIITIQSKEASYFELIDSFGNVILSKNIFDGQQSINVHDLSPGIYFARFISSEEIQIEKILLE